MRAFKRLAVCLTTTAVFAVSSALTACPGAEETGAPRITNHGTGQGYAGFCLLCHGPGSGINQFPPDHTGRTNEMCLTCHKS